VMSARWANGWRDTCLLLADDGHHAGDRVAGYMDFEVTARGLMSDDLLCWDRWK